MQIQKKNEKIILEYFNYIKTKLTMSHFSITKPNVTNFLVFQIKKNLKLIFTKYAKPSN